MSDEPALPGQATYDELRSAWQALKVACFCQPHEGVEFWIWAAGVQFDFGQFGLLGLGVPGFQVEMQPYGLSLRAFDAVCVIPWMQVLPSSLQALQDWHREGQRQALAKAGAVGDRRFGFPKGGAADTTIH